MKLTKLIIQAVMAAALGVMAWEAHATWGSIKATRVVYYDGHDLQEGLKLVSSPSPSPSPKKASK